MTQVVRLKQNIKAGQKLEADALETTTIPAASVPGGASSAIDSYRGKYAVTQLFAGDILTASKVRDTLVDPIAAGAAKGKQLVSVTLPSLSSGVSGALQPGDVVAVMVTSKVTQFNQQLGLLVATEQSTIVTSPSEETDDNGEIEGEGNDTVVNQTLLSSIQKESQTYIPEELRYLEVCKITSSDGTDALMNAAKDPDQPNRLPTTVTFYATEEQALKLAEIEQNAELHIAFLARGDAADVFIPREDRVLVEESIPDATTTPQPTAPTTAESTSVPLPSDQPTVTDMPVSPDEPASTEEPTPAETDVPMPTVEPLETLNPEDIDFNDPEVGE